MSDQPSTLDAAQHAAAVRKLAEQAYALREDLDVVREVMCASDEEAVKRAGYRLGELTSNAMEIVNELRRTGVVLDRISAVPADACRLPWGICPVHGNTLSSSGGVSTCQKCRWQGVVLDGQVAPGRWDFDRFDGPCPEPKTHEIAFPNGERLPMCDGHAKEARQTVEDGSVKPLRGVDES